MNYEISTHAKFNKWLDNLSINERSSVDYRIEKVSRDLLGDVEPVGNGVSELKFKKGRGVRIYFTIRNKTIVFLLVGGDKSTQKKDIKEAKLLAQRFNND